MLYDADSTYEYVANAVVISQALVSAFTGQTGLAPVVGWAWYGLWSLLGMPTWWTTALLMRTDYTTMKQEATCALWHIDSLAYVMVMGTLTCGIIAGFGIFVPELVERTVLDPKRAVHDMSFYWRDILIFGATARIFGPDALAAFLVTCVLTGVWPHRVIPWRYAAVIGALIVVSPAFTAAGNVITRVAQEHYQNATGRKEGQNDC